MTTWLFERDAETEPGVFVPGQDIDLKAGDTVYLFDVDPESIVGPFDYERLPQRSNTTDDEGHRVLLTPVEDRFVQITKDQILNLVDGPELGQGVVDTLQAARHLPENTIPSASFFEPENSDRSDEEPTTEEPSKPSSLKQVFNEQQGVKSTDFSDQEVPGGKPLTDTTLRGSDLSDATLEEVTFKNVNLRDVDFRGANLQGATFTGYETQLAGADFTGARLKNAFFEVDVSACCFSDTQLSDADFTAASLEGADFSHARMKRAKFNYCEPLRANFNHAVVQDIKTKGATFEKASFVGADLSNTNFVDTEFQDVDFSHADMKQVTFKTCTLSDSNFSRANLSGVTLKDHDTDNIDFEQATLRNGTLSGSRFTSARFDGARLSGTKFVECDLSGTSLKGVRANDAVFDDANLEFATLAESDLSGASFDAARLYNCQLVSARVDAATNFESLHDYATEKAETDGEEKEHPKQKAASVYRTLEAVYRDNSLTSKSLMYLRKRKDAMYAMNKEQTNFRKVVIDGFLKYTTGHGTRLRNLLGVSVIFILVTAALHSALGTVAHDSSLGGNDPNVLTDFGLSLLVSSLAFTGFGYARFSPVNLAGEVLTVIQSGGGVIFFGLLVFILSTRASR